MTALDTPVCLLHSPARHFRRRQQAHSAGHSYRIISVKMAIRLEGIIGKYSGRGKGRYSSVGIATIYGLHGPGIESRWEGARFSAPVQTGSGAHPAFYQ